MDKKYPDQLGDWINGRPVAARDRHLVDFRTVSDDVRAALAVGYSVKTIWRNLQESGRITVSYSAFVRHVRKLAPPPPDVLHGLAAASESPALKHSASKPEKPPGFVFNPKPNKEELL